MRIAASISSLYLDFVYSKRENLHFLIFAILSLLTATLIFAGAFARVYLFAHTLNQIFMGVSIGILIAIFMHFYVKK